MPLVPHLFTPVEVMFMLLSQPAAMNCLEETGNIESNTKPLAFPEMLEAQGGQSRCCCRVCLSWLTTYPHAAHLSFCTRARVGTGSLESPPHHRCTMLAHLLHFGAKTMFTAF